MSGEGGSNDRRGAVGDDDRGSNGRRCAAPDDDRGPSVDRHRAKLDRNHGTGVGHDRECASDLHRRARQLFPRALGLPEGERAAFLQEACGGDRELQAEVESLLAHVTGPIGTFADTAASPSPGAVSGTEVLSAELPATIGPYQLVARLGAGGMGEVYRAEQESPVRRTVALKVIKLGMDTREVVARFEAERQAAALMSHPAVARIYDAGATDEGRPYFVMEYVDGDPITEFCDNHRLSLGERLALIEQVCAGVQHAHQNGVIHRDLKPGNVLVTLEDGAPVAKVIDFGIAKAIAGPLTDQTLETAIGQFVGTPDYMSPEQAKMGGVEVDTRADVYALGVVLYELLVGAGPFEPGVLREAGFDHLRRIIREVEPRAPSARVAAMAPEAKRAVAQRRAAEPEALIRHLRGELDWIVGMALEKDRERRYQTPAELAADLRRHREHQPVLAAPPGAAYRAAKFVRRHRLAVGAAAVAAGALILGTIVASIGFARAIDAERRASAEAATARQVADFVLGMFRGFDPSSLQEMTRTPREVLDLTAARIDAELADQPLVGAEMQDRLGGIYSNLGLYEAARPLLEKALATRRAHLGDDDPAVAKTTAGLGWLEYAVGNYSEALDRLRRALEISEATDEPDGMQISLHLSGIGAVLSRLGDYPAALEHLERARRMQERLLGPDDINVINTTYELARVQMELGDWQSARTSLERTAAARRALTGPDNLAVAAAELQLGIFLDNMGELDAAEELVERALEVRERALGEDHPDVAHPLQSLAYLRLEAGDYREALDLFERALRIRRQALGPDHPDVAASLRGLGRFHDDTGDFAAARGHYEDALEILEPALGEEHTEIGTLLVDVGRAIARSGDPAAARPVQERALGILEHKTGPDGPAVARALHRLGDTLRDLGESTAASEHYERALNIRTRVMGEDHPGVASILSSQAVLHSRHGEWQAARPLLERALAIREARFGPEHISLARNLERLADVIRRGGGDPATADGLDARAEAIRASHGGALPGR